MTVKTMLSFTDQHQPFLTDKGGEGAFTAQSAAMAAALEQASPDEEERAVALDAMAAEIRARMRRPRAEYVGPEGLFAVARASIYAAPQR